MPHYELLAKIDQQKDNAIEGFVFNDVFDALRAVVELHTPRSSGPFEFCFECNGWDEEDGTEYPCPTIQAIEEQLK